VYYEFSIYTNSKETGTAPIIQNGWESEEARN